MHYQVTRHLGENVQVADHAVKFSIDKMVVIHGKVLQLVSKHTNIFDEMFDSLDMNNGNGEISFTE